MSMLEFSRTSRLIDEEKKLGEAISSSASGGASPLAMKKQAAIKSLRGKLMGPSGQTTVEQGATTAQAGAASKMNKVAAGAMIAKDALGIQADKTDSVGSGLEGAASGALMGAQVGGMPGAIIGGGVGALKGILGARSARKRARSEAASAHHQRIASIEGEKTQRLNQALANMASAFTQTLV